MLQKTKSRASKPAEAAPAAAKEAEPESAPVRAGIGLTEIMARDEPQRTAALEKAANSGQSFNLKSRTGREVRVRYGKVILTVPPTPKPFTAPHAIHLLFVSPQLVEEVE